MIHGVLFAVLVWPVRRFTGAATAIADLNRGKRWRETGAGRRELGPFGTGRNFTPRASRQRGRRVKIHLDLCRGGRECDGGDRRGHGDATGAYDADGTGGSNRGRSDG